MNASKISMRYAKALFLHALEINKLEIIRKDIEILFEISLVPEFNLCMLSPVVKESEKKKFSKSLFEKTLSQDSRSFVDLLISNKRESYITDAARNFLSLYKDHFGIKSVELISAEVLSPEDKTKIIAIVKEKTKSIVEITEKIDKSIIGGYILRIGDQQYDASVSTKLYQLKKKLSETSLIA